MKNFPAIILVLVFIVYSNALPLSNQGFKDSLWEGKNYRPPHFSQSMYKATVLDSNIIEVMDGPIILDNTSDGMYFVITSDNYEDYIVTLVDTNTTSEVQIQIELTSTEPINREFDVIILEALDNDQVPVSRTTILVFNSNKVFDMYKMKFKIDDSEYIVLNYYYFKWFLALLTFTGLLILIIELYEIIKNIKIARENETFKHNIKYQELLHI